MSNEYLTSNSQIAYPFVDDAHGLVRNGPGPAPDDPLLPLDFFVDAVAVLGAGDGTLCLRSIARGGSDFLFTFSDMSGTVIIANHKDLSELPPAFGICTFETVTGDINTSSSLRLVTGESFLPVLTAMSNGTIQYGATLQFAQGCVEPKPERVSAIKIDSDYIVGVCRLVEGYNCGLSQDVDLFRAVGAHASRIALRLEPGLGMGKYDPCDNPDPIDYLARINSASPDEEGNLTLSPGQCHNFLADPANNRLFVGNVCTPCCDCQDYANVVTYLSNTLGRLSHDSESDPGILEHINNIVNKMNVAISDPINGYNVRIKVRKAFTVSLTGTIGYDGACAANPAKPPTICMVVIRITNGYSEVKGPVTISGLDIVQPDDEYATFAATACWVSWRDGTGQWRSRRDVAFYDDMVAGIATIDSIQPGSTVMITCRLKVSAGIAEGTGTVTVQVDSDEYSASGSWEGDPDGT